MHREKRRDEAWGRLETRAYLAPQEQLQRLDERLGKGRGAKRERARLVKEIENA